jgi:hypothetical protein
MKNHWAGPYPYKFVWVGTQGLVTRVFRIYPTRVRSLDHGCGSVLLCEVTKICQGYQLNLEKERAVILFPTLLHSLSRINSFARVSYIRFLHQAVQYCMTNQRLRGAKTSPTPMRTRVSVSFEDILPNQINGITSITTHVATEDTSTIYTAA